MSGAVKPRAAAPSATPQTAAKEGVVQNGKPATPQQRSTDECDEPKADSVDGSITLDVILPNGQRTDIIVDYSTPLLDLLVCLAGKCKLNPSGLALQILSDDTGQPLTYKPNQMVGSLAGRVVRIVSKEELAGKSKNKKPEKSFEITQRFTVNLPRGQKTVVRVSPLKTLAEVVSEVCQDKGLDPCRHALQIPGRPGVPVDLNCTVQQMGIYEMNLISSGFIEKNHTNSMPDLSRAVPKDERKQPFTPSLGETKKKKGFLSFLKKDKKTKLSVHVDSNQNVNTVQAQKATTPPSQRYSFSSEREAARPKSMFVMGSNVPEDSISKSSVDKIQALPRKKRLAPAPPVPPQAQSSSSSNHKDSNETNVLTNQHNNNNNSNHTISPLTQRDEIIPLPQSSREDLLNRLHSRNSSDSSGYHEITLSGCESPEAAHHVVSKFKTSIDSTSIESADNPNGDGNIQDTPARIPPIAEVQERAEAAPKKGSAPSTGTLPSRKKGKAPAPPPPPSAKAAAPSPPSHVGYSHLVKAEITAHPSHQKVDIVDNIPKAKETVNSAAHEVHVDPEFSDYATIDKIARETFNSAAHEVQVDTEVPEYATVNKIAKDKLKETETLVQREETAAVKEETAVVKEETAVVKEEIAVVKEDTVVVKVETIVQKEKTVPKVEAVVQDESENEDTEVDSGTAFDINDILEGIVFDEDPKSLDFRILSPRTDDDDDENYRYKDKDAMLMMETASVTSEDIEQLIISPHLERPCAFIPPPPPTEPPPAEEAEEDDTCPSYEPVFADKGTEVNEDNTSLAPLSAKSSPRTAHKHRDSIVSLTSIDTIESLSLDFEQAILMGEEAFSTDLEASSGYKNEMALFVERMSKVALQGTQDSADEAASPSVLSSDTNSDTGSVIRHFRSDSRDSKSESEPGSLTRMEGKKIGSAMGPTSEHVWHGVSTSVMEIPADPLPPPPQFIDTHEMDQAKEEEDEEFIETIEELIVPLGPNGYDFGEAKKVSVESTKPETNKEVTIENITGVFRAEPLSISAMIHLPTLVHHNKPKTPESVQSPAQKEEFVLTNEDLSSVSFLPPKVLRAKAPVETMPLVKVSHASLLLDGGGGKGGGGSPSTRLQKHGEDGRTKVTNKQSFTVKTFPVSSLPSMKVSRVDAMPEKEYSSIKGEDPLVNRSTPKLLLKASQGNSGNVGGHVTVTTVETSSDVVDGISSESSQSHDQKESFAVLKAQFSHWEEQLAKNNSVLVSQAIGKEPPAQPQQDFQDKSKAKRQSLMAVIKSKDPTKIQVTPAAPPAPPIAQLKTTAGSERAKSQPQPKSKFERQLDPREQLMLAIRNFNGRESLKSVPVKQAHWV